MATVERGLSHPLGPTMTAAGTNFSLYSKHASSVELLLYDRVGSSVPGQLIPLQRTGEYWHAFVPDVGHGQSYAYRVDGPWQLERGLRFDARHRLLDPFGRGVGVPTTYRRSPASVPLGDAEAMKSVLVESGDTVTVGYSIADGEVTTTVRHDEPSVGAGGEAPAAEPGGDEGDPTTNDDEAHESVEAPGG